MRFANPQENVLQLGLYDGMKIADIGSGSGHYALAAAAAVGERGRIYAIDIQEDVLKHLKATARARRLYNLEIVWSDVERPLGTGLRDSSIDAAIVSNVLFQLPNKPALVKEARRVLRPGGRTLVVDWAGSYGGIGPAAHLVFPEHEAEALFINCGFHKIRSLRAGPHHYGILFTAPEV